MRAGVVSPCSASRSTRARALTRTATPPGRAAGAALDAAIQAALGLGCRSGFLLIGRHVHIMAFTWQILYRGQCVCDADRWNRGWWCPMRADREVDVMNNSRMTMAQALVRFLAAQHVQRDGVRSPFIAGCFGILGHGTVAGLGQAFQQHADVLPFIQGRNEQAMAHTAIGYARQRNRLATYACTSSIGPGATNMVTAAALATINRLPVLLLPSDTFARRAPHPVLQQLEMPHDQTVSVNDSFRPVSRFFDRIQRPEQLFSAALEAMRVLTDPAETGAVTLALPEDVQAETVDVPDAFLVPRTWTLYRQPPAPEALAAAMELITAARRPLILAGGGVIYAEATSALRALVDATGIPVCETQ